MQLGRHAARAEMPHAMHEAGLEMARAEQLEQRALGIRVADDHVGRERLAAREQHARDAIAIERDVSSPGVESANGRAGGRRCLGESRRSPRPCRRPAGTRPPVVPLARPESRCSSASTELLERGERLVPSTASKASAAFSAGDLEGLLDDVEDVDAGDAQELAHVVAAETADVEAEQRRRRWQSSVRRPAGAADVGCAVCRARART